MKIEPIDGGLKKLKEDLTKMTFKDKVNHLWTYYKSSLVVLAVIIALISVVVTCIQNKNTKTLLAGMGINVTLTEEGKAYIQDEYFQLIKTEGREQILYTETTQEDFTNPSSLEESYNLLMMLVAMSVTGDLDYFFADELAIRNMLAHQLFNDLRTVYTEEELAAMGDKVLWAQVGGEEDGRYMPFAINVSDLPFIQEHSQSASDTYLILITNSTRGEQVKAFLEYLKAWTPAA